MNYILQAVLTQNEIDKILAYLKNPEDLCQILPDLSQSQRAKFKYKVLFRDLHAKKKIHHMPHSVCIEFGFNRFI